MQIIIIVLTMKNCEVIEIIIYGNQLMVVHDGGNQYDSITQINIYQQSYILYHIIQKKWKMNPFHQIFPYTYYYSPRSAVYLAQGQFLVHQQHSQRQRFQKKLSIAETALTQLQLKYDNIILQNTNLKKKLSETLISIENKKQIKTLKRKIIRRKQDQLEKINKCCYGNCKKQYASILALNLHIKTKHGGGTKKQRDELAKQIILAQLHGTQIPQPSINLPENYVEKIKKQIFSNQSQSLRIKLKDEEEI